MEEIATRATRRNSLMLAHGSRAARSNLNLWAPWIILALLTAVDAAGFSWLAVARHQAFQSHAFDLGNMDQGAWNTIHGHLLRFTDMAVGQRVLTSRLAIHVEPALAVLSLLYFIHPAPETLLLAQAVIVASGAVPAYLLARRVWGRPWPPLVFPLAYLLHPSMQNAVLDDFHAVTLSATFLLWAFYFLWKRSLPGFVVFAVLAASTKEDVSLLIAMLGLVLLWQRRMVAGAVTIVAGSCWFLVCVLVIIPANNPAGRSPYLGRYSYLGHGLAGILFAPIRNPALVLHALTSPSRLSYLSDLLHPLGFVPLLGLPVLLLALPAFLITMLSADPRMYSGYYQYPVEIVPYLLAGALAGIVWIDRVTTGVRRARVRWIPFILIALLVVASVVDSWRWGFSPLSYGYVAPSAGPHQRLEENILRKIPPQAVVAAADEIEPHLSERRWIYLLPTVHTMNGPRADYLVMDASIPSSPVLPRTLRAVARHALGHGFGVAAASDGILLLSRRATSKHLPRTFYSFIYTSPARAGRSSVSWGRLALTGFAIHPGDGLVNRARPAIGVETWWRVSRGLPVRARIIFYLSPVYSGVRPHFSSAWLSEPDSATWDWLPLSAWPVSRVIHAASLEMQPTSSNSGSVDVAVRVIGLGSARGLPPSERVVGAPGMVRLGTVRVEP